MFTVLFMGFEPGFVAEAGNAVSYNKAGWDYLKKSRNFKAVFSFKNALKLNPRYKQALTGLAKAYYEIEVYDQAIELYNRVLKIDRKSPVACTGLGMAFTRKGKYSEALEYFNAAAEFSEEDLDARYGIAFLYYSMDKIIWSKRKVDHILRINPYHYDSLLLMADIKSRENRLNEARGFVEKAIETDRDSPAGFIRFGQILFRDYLVNDNSDSLSEAKYAINNALSINSENYQANRMMGIISYAEKRFSDACVYYKKALSDVENPVIYYSLAVSYDKAGRRDEALKYFLKALKRMPSDSILRTRLEDFLVFHDYKTGHPARIMLNREHYDLALSKMDRNLPYEVIMYLRRSLLLNAMDKKARQDLMNYNFVQDYNRFYIDEIKNLLRLYPGKKYQDVLSVAIVKRRSMLYHKEGYSADRPPRDVPRVLVLNFQSRGLISSHPDAGEVISSSLSFVMGQFGRMNVPGIRKRADIARGLRCDNDNLEKSLEIIGEKIKKGAVKKTDFIVYGDFNENNGHISLSCRLLDFHKGVVISEFTISSTQKEALPEVSLRAAKRIYRVIPFEGRVLKLKNNGILINLGLFDGMNRGDKFVVYKTLKSKGSTGIVRKKMVFRITDSNTLVSFAVPEKRSDLKEIDSRDRVFPLRKRRAKRLD